MPPLFFIDASALAKRYSPEIGTDVVNHLFAAHLLERICVLNIGLAEVVSVLQRKRNLGKLSDSIYYQSLATLRAEIVDQSKIRKIVADTPLVISAFPLIHNYSINATDAILLRSALDLAIDLRFNGDDLVLVAADQRLLRAALAEGLTIFNPETEAISDLDLLLA